MDSLNTGLLAGGSTLMVLIASLKLLYSALKDERARLTALGDKYIIELKQVHEMHAIERDQWQHEKEYFKVEIDALRSQVSDLYHKLYKFEQSG